MILFRYRSVAVPLQFWSVMVGNGVLRSVTVKLLRDEIIKIDIKKLSKLRALINISKTRLCRKMFMECFEI